VNASSLRDNRDYYDRFSEGYERERGHGYHALIDDLQVDLAAPYCSGRDVLEVGCGSGLILARTAPLARSAVGIDISRGMLAKARARRLHVIEGSATDLPFADESFDTIYSFKVLAHVREISRAVADMARVTRPGGHLLLEFYNVHSLRYLAKRLKPAQAVADGVTDEEVFTRYDRPDDVLRYLPPDVDLVDFRGIRVATPVAAVHDLPVLKDIFERLEWWGRDGALRRFGGFLVAILRKRGGAL
jgi:ubiquinone/menaquinone biosynthesis C-methylase UbiE